MQVNVRKYTSPMDPMGLQTTSSNNFPMRKSGLQEFGRKTTSWHLIGKYTIPMDPLWDWKSCFWRSESGMFPFKGYDKLPGGVYRFDITWHSCIFPWVKKNLLKTKRGCEAAQVKGDFSPGLPRTWDPLMVSGTHTMGPISLGIRTWEWD